MLAGRPGNDWEDDVRCALARCIADDEGWVGISDLGTEVKAARVKLAGGKLSELTRKVRGIKCRVKTH